MKNRQVPRNPDYTIFHSADIESQANFLLKTKRYFDEDGYDDDSLYRAKIVRFFGNFVFHTNYSHRIFMTFFKKSDEREEAADWQRSKRSHALEAIYNEARLNEQQPLHPTVNDAEISLEKVIIDEVDAVETTDAAPANNLDDEAAAGTCNISGDGAIEVDTAAGQIIDLTEVTDDASPQMKIEEKPGNCKVEYDEMSGYIPFEIDVSPNFLCSIGKSWKYSLYFFHLAGIRQSKIFLPFEDFCFEIVYLSVD